MAKSKTEIKSVEAHLTRLTNLLYEASKHRYNRNITILFRDVARNSIGLYMPAKSLELKHTIKLTAEIDEVKTVIKQIVNSLDSTLLTTPGIGYSSAAMILAETGDFSNFKNSDKTLAFVGMSPSTYHSGQLTNCYAHMEKRGSKHLRFALYNATKYVCNWDSNFGAYLAKKGSEGRHYNVALSHASLLCSLIRLYSLDIKFLFIEPRFCYTLFPLPPHDG